MLVAASVRGELPSMLVIDARPIGRRRGSCAARIERAERVSIVERTGAAFFHQASRSNSRDDQASRPHLYCETPSDSVPRRRGRCVS
ncbi:MAG: hypothetical protein ACK5U8_12175, partial [Deltaproteobacteria bacterium]